MSASAKLLQSSASFYGRKYLEVVSALPPTDVPSQGDRSQVGGINEIAFDYNLVVILAALLCVLVGALGLKSMVRSALCCNRQVVSDSTDDVAIQLDNNGLKKKDMRVLPAIVYSAGSLFLKAGGDCPICLTEFVEGENVRVLPKCNHSFHVDCIDMWLFAHSSCPTCRHCLLDIISDTKSGSAPSCDPSSSVQPSESEGSQMVPSNPLVESNERPFAVPDDTSPLPSSNSIASADLEAEENASQS